MNNVLVVAILTKSAKRGGYCVAGIEVTSCKWIRLVSSNIESHGALTDRDMKCRDGSMCEVLDIVRVPIIKSVPSAYQPENVLIDEHRYWVKIGSLSVEQMLNLHPVEEYSYLFGNTYCYIPEDTIDTVGRSLILVQVSDLEIARNEFKKTKANFIYRGTTYRNISVTDRDYYGVPDITIKSAILVMSLPDVPYSDELYYKFVAKVFPL